MNILAVTLTRSVFRFHSRREGDDGQIHHWRHSVLCLRYQQQLTERPRLRIRAKLKGVFKFTIKKGLAMLFAWFAPSINNIFRLNFVEERTNNYIRQSVWNTVEYRWGKYFKYSFNEAVLRTLCVQKLSSPTLCTITAPLPNTIQLLKKNISNPQVQLIMTNHLLLMSKWTM